MPTVKGAPTPLILVQATESEYAQTLSRNRRANARGRITIIEKSAQRSARVLKLREYMKWIEHNKLGRTYLLAENKTEWIYQTLFTS